jgi:hypothetical protein
VPDGTGPTEGPDEQAVALPPWRPGAAA